MWEVILVTGAIATALGATWKWVIKPFGKFVGKAAARAVHAIDALERVAPHLDEVPVALPVLMEIAAQFHPNEGKSLHDQIEILRQAVCELQKTVENHYIATGGRPT